MVGWARVIWAGEGRHDKGCTLCSARWQSGKRNDDPEGEKSYKSGSSSKKARPRGEGGRGL